jgi:plasmid stability protein
VGALAGAANAAVTRQNQPMRRTVVDLPDRIHEQVRALASRHGQSVSSTICVLVARGLETTGRLPTSHVAISDVTGLPVLRLGLGRTLTATEALRLADEAP